WTVVRHAGEVGYSIAGFGYWAALVALTAAATLRFGRSRIAAIIVTGLVLIWVVSEQAPLLSADGWVYLNPKSIDHSSLLPALKGLLGEAAGTILGSIIGSLACGLLIALEGAARLSGVLTFQGTLTPWLALIALAALSAFELRWVVR